jgi:RNA polymerase sigma-70 factor, ECF subfamily
MLQRWPIRPPEEPHVPQPYGKDENAKVEAFTQLLATCQRRVFLYALGLVHNPTDAEEILQQTNLVLWRKFEQFEQGTGFDRWACRIAYYEVLKAREKQGRMRLFSGDFIDTMAADVEKSLDLLDERREALSGCLKKLREKDRYLVMQRYQHRATTRGVAEALGRSVQGTRKSLHRIRMSLLACIERTLAAKERA